MTLPQVDHLAALEQLCRRKGWRLLLRSSEVGKEKASVLTFLDVVGEVNGVDGLVRRWPLEGPGGPVSVTTAAELILATLREEAA